MNQNLKRLAKWVIGLALIVLILIMGIKFIVDFFDPEREEQTYQEWKYYGIKADSLLNSLTQGGPDVFMPLSEALNETSPQPVRWKGAEYYQVALAFQAYISKESSANWSLKNMTVGMDCADIRYGPQYGSFVFFKTAKTRERASRIKHHITVVPGMNYLLACRNEMRPPNLHCHRSSSGMSFSFRAQRTAATWSWTPGFL